MTDDPRRLRLVRHGFVQEDLPLAWNVADIVILTIAAMPVALAGFGLDSLIEIGGLDCRQVRKSVLGVARGQVASWRVMV